MTAPLDDAAQRTMIETLIAEREHLQGPLLEILHAVQDRLGHVPAAAVGIIAARLNLSRAEVQGVLSFYPHFRHSPPGRHVLQVCRAEACQAMRGGELEQQARARLGIDFHQTTADGAVSLEPVYCLGNCACAPSWMLDGELRGRLDEASADGILAQFTTSNERLP